MRESLLDLLVCPECQEPLECRPATVAADGDIVTGELRCARCDGRFRIENGIPRFVPSENYGASFGYQWNKFRREQIDSLQGIQQSERRLRTETGWEPDWLRGKWILDAGCGAGRFLEVASRTAGCEAVGVDISGAVDAVKETLAGRKNAHLVQASIFKLPFRPGAFIQHTPDPASAIRALARMVRAGGRIALTMYERRRFTMLYSKYWVRPLTRRLPQPQLLTLIKVLMPPAFALSEVLFRLPVVGRAFRFAIPVANYVDDPELTWRQRYRWAILDTFDMLAPAFDTPQREDEVVSILTQEGVAGVTRLPNAGLNLVGTKA
jgi:uncharacterized protein YbaR (Trm112 family)/ubiquinone/menaquinone biosynthesis C-methylase UbiE